MVTVFAARFQLISILLPVVSEVGEQTVNIQIRAFIQLVIEGAGHAITGAIIQILLNVELVEGDVSVTIQIWHRLHIVDAAAVIVVAVAKHHAPALVRPKAHSRRRVDQKGLPAIVDRRIAILAFESERWLIGGCLFYAQIDRTSDCVAVLVR